MIGRLRGTVAAKTPPVMLIDVNGVGYDVEVSMNTLFKCPEVGESVTLLTHFVVREDAQLLYGFSDERERQLFRDLIKVNGVGPKLAITILSSIEPNQFVFCVQQQDTASLVKLPGVGKKTAERLVIEMKDRLKDWVGETRGSTSTTAPANSATQEAVAALITLGYKPPQATRMVALVDAEGKSSENLIRDALKQQALA